MNYLMTEDQRKQLAKMLPMEGQVILAEIEGTFMHMAFIERLANERLQHVADEHDGKSEDCKYDSSHKAVT